jgi:uncharacterized protein
MAALATIGLLLATPVRAQQPVPALTARVIDLTATLGADRIAALDARLAAFESRTGSQIAVLLVPSTQPESIEQYALRVAEAWQLGRDGIDDGLLLLIAKEDRTLRIEVGYGLEGAVPDALANRIIDERIVPRFYRDDFAGGISDGVDALVGLVEGEALPPPAATAPAAPRDGAGALPFVMFAAFVLAPFFRRVLGRLLGAATLAGLAGAIAWAAAGVLALSAVVGLVVFLIVLLGVGGPGRWSSGGIPWGRGGMGGGFRGGGFGGFRGGGGSFGGGGASGRW